MLVCPDSSSCCTREELAFVLFYLSQAYERALRGATGFKTATNAAPGAEAALPGWQEGGAVPGLRFGALRGAGPCAGRRALAPFPCAPFPRPSPWRRAERAPSCLCPAGRAQQPPWCRRGRVALGRLAGAGACRRRWAARRGLTARLGLRLCAAGRAVLLFLPPLSGPPQHSPSVCRPCSAHRPSSRGKAEKQKWLLFNAEISK